MDQFERQILGHNLTDNSCKIGKTPIVSLLVKPIVMADGTAMEGAARTVSALLDLLRVAATYTNVGVDDGPLEEDFTHLTHFARTLLETAAEIDHRVRIAAAEQRRAEQKGAA